MTERRRSEIEAEALKTECRGCGKAFYLTGDDDVKGFCTLLQIARIPRASCHPKITRGLWRTFLRLRVRVRMDESNRGTDIFRGDDDERGRNGEGRSEADQRRL